MTKRLDSHLQSWNAVLNGLSTITLRHFLDIMGNDGENLSPQATTASYLEHDQEAYPDQASPPYPPLRRENMPFQSSSLPSVTPLPPLPRLDDDPERGTEAAFPADEPPRPATLEA